MRPVIHKIFFLSLLMISCDVIEENDRLILDEPETARRVVLLEEFTGQRCTNCPKATDVTDQLLNEYGDSLIVVCIHAGPLSFKGNATTTGLATDIGEEYYSHWNIDYLPVGMVNRSAPLDYNSWNTIIREELKSEAPISIDMDCKLAADDTTLTVKSTMTGIGGPITGKLQLWLIEDGIKAIQLMSDGSSKDDYIHRHVFRTAINGLWGEDVFIEKGKTLCNENTVTLEKEWDPPHLAVVAFVYDETGVLQVSNKRLYK